MTTRGHGGGSLHTQLLPSQCSTPWPWPSSLQDRRADDCCLSPWPVVSRSPQQRNTPMTNIQASSSDPAMPMPCCPGGPASPCSHPLHRPQAPPDARQAGIGPFVSLPHELASQEARPSDFPPRHLRPPSPHHFSNKPFPQKLKLKSQACSLPHHPDSCSAPCRAVNASLHVDDHFSTHTQGPTPALQPLPMQSTQTVGRAVPDRKLHPQPQASSAAPWAGI